MNVPVELYALNFAVKKHLTTTPKDKLVKIRSFVFGKNSKSKLFFPFTKVFDVKQWKK